MAYKVSGTTIVMTRGDTMVAPIFITDANGEPYTPNPGDEIRFAMKANYSDKAPILKKTIPIDTLTLTLEPNDTKHLEFGGYVYDMQLTTADGVVDTFIPKGNIMITEEVD